MSLTIARTTDLAAPLEIRARVFMDEQGVSLADEIDGADPDCLHWLASDAQGPVATLRVLPMGPVAKIQRVAVLPRARRTGLGSALMRQVMRELRAMGFETALLGAQTEAMAFYERLGFAAHGPVYDDAGIPHRDMSRAL
ncbi:GNAT family N-acetyltransferase [Jannaschia seohaensis]|uniref:Predicted N-acyltransferase, GNAT family n=1 Tax=Jannaschia seohaensis TaxID=475081 RepID=A0A2Y9A6Z7_9RHOB|nr:GNAT family N-acetyltransferase [Jannaschia seohaensis]PWJ21669.1 putative GNAT family N-acyltransferase [Jannaschia seohaensis]SSA37947.1 Predicted N-acyltransferase, GNAT family [Jannaschia seohaensis]